MLSLRRKISTVFASSLLLILAVITVLRNICLNIAFLPSNCAGKSDLLIIAGVIAIPIILLIPVYLNTRSVKTTLLAFAFFPLTIAFWYYEFPHNYIEGLLQTIIPKHNWGLSGSFSFAIQFTIIIFVFELISSYSTANRKRLISGLLLNALLILIVIIILELIFYSDGITDKLYVFLTYIPTIWLLLSLPTYKILEKIVKK